MSVAFEGGVEAAEHVVGVELFAGLGGDPHEVVVAASGGADVKRGVGGAVVDDHNGPVDGEGLGGVDGAGVPQLDVLGDVGGVQPGAAVLAGDGEAGVVVDVVDGPAVPVGDEFASVGALVQVLASDDLIAAAGGVP